MIYKNFKDYRQAWDNADKIDPIVPLNIDIELVSTCNLRCPFCFIPDPSFESFISQKAADGLPLRRIMSKEMAFHIIDQCSEIGVPSLKFNWRGESTLHPNYSEIVRYAKLHVNKNNLSPFFELLANTNANCNHKAMEGLLCTTKCMVSLDSMVAETYEKMRVGGNFSLAKDVITGLIHFGHTNVWVRRIITKENYTEPFFVQVKEKWGDKVHVSEHYCFDRNINQSHELSGCDHDSRYPRKYCQYPSQRLVISSAGFIYPCCIDLHETMSLGNIRNKSIMNVWNGPDIKLLRKNLRSANTTNMTETCKYCESWMSYDMPQREFVKDKEIINAK